jgi:endonuclease I/V8-like Glu-specific endopeptidase
MLLDTTLLDETEQRFTERQATREEGVKLIRAGNLLQADSPGRVQARLKRLGIDRLVAERAAVGIWGEVRRRIKDPNSRSMAAGSTEKERAYTVMAQALGVEPGAMSAEDMEVNEMLLERIVGENDLLGISYMDRGLTASRAIGCVRLFKNGRFAGSGTGFMVSPRLLMTNNHVLERAATGREARVVFNFQDDPGGNPLPTVTFALEPDTFFLTSQPLDFSLIAVARQSHDGRDLEEFGWLPLIEAEGKVINGEYVTIVQHPNGQPKQIALRENQIIDILENFLHYSTDTAPGSSGSPVFNDQWEVVGLHHSGVPRRDTRGRILTRDNTLWTAAMGDEAIHWIANEGVRVSRILKHVKSQPLSREARRLRDQLFEAKPPISGPEPRPTPLVGSNRPVKGGSSQSLVVEGPPTADWGATWTIPLQITVHVGKLRLDQSPAQPGVAGTIEPRPNPPISSSVTPSLMDTEVTAAIEEARRAGTKSYYDQTADSAARKKYYKGVRTSVSPAKLFAKLSSLITNTHGNRPVYRPGKEVYPWIDLQPNLKLRSIYSRKEFEPEELIREDFRIEQERVERLRELALRESTVTATQFQEQLDFLEASLPFNCEHVVPQSWFAKKEPMRGDLHHLFACESGCNSFRGNTPYFDFPDFEEVVRNECGKREGNKFEPGDGKGAVARATLYFLLRYPGEINRTVKEYTRDRLATLLTWHKEFPVDDYERHRNQAIFERQGNRNPLIDHPKWAPKIDFRLGLGAG